MDTPTLPFGEVCYRDLADLDPTCPWLWQGLIAPTQFTLLTSPPKTGKTTLLAALLAKRANETAGNSPATLAGLAVAPGPSAIVSEEPRHVWRARGRSLAFRDDTTLFCRPFTGKPTRDELKSHCNRLGELHTTNGTDLAVFDSLVHFLPRGAENNPDLLVDSLAPLRALAEAGVAVLALHHPAKRRAGAEHAARGTAALPGYVDISLELRLVNPRDKGDRRRYLAAASRWPDTPPLLFIEWSADGSDYRVLDIPDEVLDGHWEGLRIVLEDAERRLTASDILKAWPPDHAVPSGTTLRRLFDLTTARGLVCHDGAGRKRDPYRYWLPQKEAELTASPRCRLDDLTRAQLLALPPEVRRAAELESAAIEWDEEEEE
jgi:hypothetical protein